MVNLKEVLETHSVFITNYRILTLESGKLSRYSDGLQDRRPGFDFRQGQNIYLFHNVQAGSGTHPASNPIGNGDCFPGGGGRSCPLASI
jgi:hypothetical protein